MVNIGTFTAQNNNFTDTVLTLTLTLNVKFVPNAKESKNAPASRIVAGNFESARRIGPICQQPLTIRRSRRPSTPTWSMTKTALTT